jgi:phosphatidylinositol alpha-mannosyltransferase
VKRGLKRISNTLKEHWSWQADLAPRADFKDKLCLAWEPAVLKIGFVFDDTLDSFDGVSQYVKTLGAWLSGQGHEVRYLVGQTRMPEWAGGKVYSLAKNRRVSFNGNQARIPLPANKNRIKQVLADEQFDVLHVQVPYSPFLAQKIINAAGKEVAVVGTFHVAPGNFLSAWGGYGLRLMYSRSLKRFDQIVSVSPAAAQYANSAFGLRTDIVPNVLDVQKFAKASKKIKFRKSRNILFFGRLVKRKGAKEMIKAFSVLHKYDKVAKLTIAGDGPERKNLEELVENLELQDSAKFLGFIEEADKAKLMAGADIVCFPSLYGESFGIVLLEAMAAGAGVVIGGNNPGYKTVLGERTQLLFDPTNALAFAGKLSELLENEEIAKELHAWQQVEVQKYDVNVVGPRITEIYQTAISKDRSKRHN